MNAPAKDLGQELREILPGVANDAMEQFFGMKSADFREQWAQMRSQLDAEEKTQAVALAERTVDGLDRSYADECRRYVSRDEKKWIGLRVGRVLRAIIGASRNRVSAEDYALNDLGSKWLADDLAQAREKYRKLTPTEKSLATTTVSAGGAIVPTEYVAELIELLRAESVIRSAGVRALPMPSGSLQMPRQSSSSTAAYAGEATNGTASDPAFELLTMVGHKLIALTAVSNDLLRQSSPQADQVVSEDLMAGMALREDLAFIRGDGTASTPRGIRYWTASGNVTSTAISSLATLVQAIYVLIGGVVNNNVKLRNPFWLMHSRTLMGILSQTDTTGQPFGLNYAGLVQQLSLGATAGPKAFLAGFPVFVSNQIPINLGGGTNESELYFVEGSQCLIGDVYDLELSVHENAAYHDGSSVVSGVNRDETVIRAISKHDFMMRHNQGAAIRTGVTLGT